MKNFIIKILNLPALFKHLFQSPQPLDRWNQQHDLDLELYSNIFKHQNLHYGFFKKIPRKPQTISFLQLEQAMESYNQLIIQKIKKKKYIIDVGCGNGNILKKLKKQKKKAIGITPNLQQINNIQLNTPQLKIINCSFEKLELSSIPMLNQIDTILMAESFQYIPLKKAIKKIKEFSQYNHHLEWIVFDYFRIKQETQNDSGHDLKTFKQELKKNNLFIQEEIDYTKHVLPTLGYVYFLINNITIPLLNHFKKNFQLTKPLLSYLLEEFINSEIKKINFEVVNPKLFSQEKKYLFIRIKNSLKKI